MSSEPAPQRDPSSDPFWARGTLQARFIPWHAQTRRTRAGDYCLAWHVSHENIFLLYRGGDFCGYIGHFPITGLEKFPEIGELALGKYSGHGKVPDALKDQLLEQLQKDLARLKRGGQSR